VEKPIILCTFNFNKSLQEKVIQIKHLGYLIGKIEEKNTQKKIHKFRGHFH